MAVLSASIFHAAGRRGAASDRGSPVTRETQSDLGEGGKDFGLTRREKQVIVFVIAGHSKKEIAQKLGVSTQAIKHDVANIFDKLAVSNRLELVLFAHHHRLIY
jgi:DNA-binding NarL/FixJ family response regulator